MDSLVIVDCQHDFIDGSLACGHGAEAVARIIDFLNTHEVKALYTSDWHSQENRSFKVNGGIWPVHCVAGTKGASLDERFARDVKEKGNRPSKENVFLKGKDDFVEEYSAFNGETETGVALKDELTPHVYVAGIATEFCVKETVLAILAAGHSVTLLKDGLGRVDEKGHEETLAELAAKGVELL